MNEEFPVSASHKLALITSLPFVHTARRYYRLSGLVRPSDWSRYGGSPSSRGCREDGQTCPLRGSKSRNKVSVGEPAEGSLLILTIGDLKTPPLAHFTFTGNTHGDWSPRGQPANTCVSVDYCCRHSLKLSLEPFVGVPVLQAFAEVADASESGKRSGEV